MDNGGIWPGDESYFQNIRETALQDTIEQLTKELAEARAEIGRKSRLIEQMREALKALRKYPNTYITTGQGAGIAEKDLAMCDAALTAERGE